MRRRLVIGPIGGVRVVLGFAWLVVFAIIIVAVATLEGVLPAQVPDAARWLLGPLIGALFLVSLAVHELAHALVARRVGIDVRTVGVAVIGTPTELDAPARRPHADAAIALAGPLVSLVIGAVLVTASLGLSAGTEWPPIALGAVLWLIGLTNLLLGGLNLLPGAPFDGGRLLRAAIWARTGDLVRASHLAAWAGRALAYAMIGVGIALVLSDRVLDGLWLAVLGWLLSQSAKISQRRVEVGQLAEGLSVSDVMKDEFAVVGPNLTVDTLVAQWEQAEGAPSVFPVVEAGALVGAIDARSLQRMPPEERQHTRVGELMTGIDRLPTLTRATPAIDALYSFDRVRSEALPVIDEQAGGQLVGMLSRASLIEALRARRAQRQAEQPAR